MTLKQELRQVLKPIVEKIKAKEYSVLQDDALNTIEHLAQVCEVYDKLEKE